MECPEAKLEAKRTVEGRKEGTRCHCVKYKAGKRSEEKRMKEDEIFEC